MTSKKSYISEFVVNWRYLTSASFGLAAGYGLVNYINNIFTPQLLSQFGWSKSDVALVGISAFLGILTQPLAGRLTDVFGVKPVASVGVVLAPLVFLGFASMTGEIWQFFMLTFIQVLVVGGTTSAVVYNQLVAQSFCNARGVAFAVAASAAPVAGAMLIPVFSIVMNLYDWRAGYLGAALFSAIFGIVALLLIPGDLSKGNIDHAKLAHQENDRNHETYRVIFRNRAFRILFVGFLLCNISFTLQTQHLQVVLFENGVSQALAALAVSLFAFSVIAGRLICGVALDRFPSHLVAMIGLGLPGIGLGLLATGASELAAMGPAVIFLGLSLGAESDILAYLVGRYFRIQIFSTVFGLLLSGLALSVASGSLLLSYLLDATGGYSVFLYVSAISVLIGGALFGFLKNEKIMELDPTWEAEADSSDRNLVDNDPIRS